MPTCDELGTTNNPDLFTHEYDPLRASYLGKIGAQTLSCLGAPGYLFYNCFLNSHHVYVEIKFKKKIKNCNDNRTNYPRPVGYISN